MPFSFQEIHNINSTTWNPVPAVYGIMNSQSLIVYIGQTNNLRERLQQHLNDTTHCMHSYQPAQVVAEVISSEQERLNRERELIAEYNPPCNQI